MKVRGVVALLAVFADAALAQSAPEPQRGGMFIEPPTGVDAKFLPLARTQGAPDAAAPSVDAAPPLEARIALDIPLRHGGVVGFGSQGAKAASPTLQADLRYTPFADSPWFARVVFYRYLHANEQQPWNPDFFYAFGYEDFRPGTWSVVYANYTGTRFGGPVNFREGVVQIAYRFALPQPMQRAFLFGDGDDATCRTGAEVTPSYVDLASLSTKHNRTALTLGCRYTRPEGWFAEVNVYAYPRHGQQQPWDPDFTYAFGLWDWRPGTLSLQYGNYSGNRFPGRARSAGEGSLRSGSTMLSWRLDW